MSITRNDFDCYVRWEGSIADYEVLVILEGPDGKSRHCRLTVGEPIQRHSVERKPFVQMPEGSSFGMDAGAFLQSIVDAAYSAGIRPSNPRDGDAALRAHLNDMRAIAFKQLKMDEPKK